MNADLRPPRATRRRILIADDCATSRMIEEIILRRRGYELLFASAGDQAVAMTQALFPDLVLLDLQMPTRSGLAALRQLKGSPLTRDVPIIVVTVCADLHVYREAAELGCAAFITKPFDAETLLLSVEKNLAERGSSAPATAPTAGIPG